MFVKRIRIVVLQKIFNFQNIVQTCRIINTGNDLIFNK